MLLFLINWLFISKETIDHAFQPNIVDGLDPEYKIYESMSTSERNNNLFGIILSAVE